MTVDDQNREMAALARATLKANPHMGRVEKCNIGLGPNELTLTVITLANGKIAKIWSEAKGLQVRKLARQNGQAVEKVEYVVADRVSKDTLRVKNTFRLEGNDLVQA